ncbi:MAG: thioredoxin-disulfide reductase [Treponema sp.]|jgi:thioredoxin reductase (NADPH)|nr:thioredoxin-disulfide reductase [Treponema sp.]
MNRVDLAIVGAGPAGLSAAQYGARAALNVLILEQFAPGGQVLRISSLENYPGLTSSAFELIQTMQEQAERFGAQFRIETVEKVQREKDFCTVFLMGGEKIQARAVIIATGAIRRLLNIPGEKEFTGKGISYCATCDGPFFKQKKIIVVGGGDSACDEAHFLSRLSSQIILVHRRDHLRAQKLLAERVLKNPNIEVRFNTRVLAFHGQKMLSSVLLETNGRTYNEEVQAVFVCIGLEAESTLIPEVHRDEEGFIICDHTMQTSIPGIYAAGDIRSSPFRQIVVAASDGAIAAHSVSNMLI